MPTGDVYGTDSRRWGMAAVLSIQLALSVGGLGLTGASVDSARTFYGISSADFNSVYYMQYASFVVGIVIGYAIMQCAGIAGVVYIGAALQVLGFSVQMAYQYSFWPVIVGGMVVDTTRAFAWLIIPTFVARWFPPGSKSLAYGTIYFGASVVAFVVVAILRFTITTAQEFDDRLMWFLIAFAAASAFLLVAAVLWFAERPRVKPGPQSADDGNTSSTLPAKLTWRANKTAVITTIVVYVVTVGPTWSTSNLALAIMNNHNYPNDDITVVALVGFVVSIPLALVVGLILSATRAYRWTAVATVLCAASFFTVIPFILDDRNSFIGIISAFQFVTGAFSMTFVECAVELAYPVPEKYVTVIMFTGAQVTGLLCTLFASFDVTFMEAMYLFLALYWAGGVVLTLTTIFCPATYQRIVQDNRTRTAAATIGDEEETGGHWNGAYHSIALDTLPIYPLTPTSDATAATGALEGSDDGGGARTGIGAWATTAPNSEFDVDFNGA